jgi:hypothetical protein
VLGRSLGGHPAGRVVDQHPLQSEKLTEKKETKMEKKKTILIVATMDHTKKQITGVKVRIKETSVSLTV